MVNTKKTKKRKIVNKVNNLTAKEWIINTKSVWRSSDYHLDQSMDEKLSLIKNLLLFFSKEQDNVLIDIDIILNPLRNLKRNFQDSSDQEVDLVIASLDNSFQNFEVYKEKLLGSYYNKINQYYDLISEKNYLCLNIKDFYFLNEEKISELIPFHSQISDLASHIGFQLKGITIWVPNTVKKSHLTTKNEITFEYILIFRKEHSKKNNYKPTLLFTPKFLSERTYFNSFLISKPPIRDKYKSQHPATFPESDIKIIISFFTHNKFSYVLDPFSGVGSTLLACAELGINGIGIELTKKWVDLTQKRFDSLGKTDELEIIDSSIINNKFQKQDQYRIQSILMGDARILLAELSDEKIDFIITSPPYWSILNKKTDHKTRKERVDKGLQKRYTQDEDVTYSADLANIENYQEFLEVLKEIYSLCFKKLKNNTYMGVIVSDFRDKAQFHLYHHETIKLLRTVGFKLTNISILYQENKNLYPYGYPYVFVSNIHHQYIIIVKKEV